LNLRVFLVTVAGALALAGTASAHMLPHRGGPSKMTPRQEYRYGVGTFRHGSRAAGRYTRGIRWLLAHDPSQTARGTEVFAAYRYAAWQAAFNHAQRQLNAHLWLRNYGRRLKVEGWRRMHPRPTYSSGGIAHRAGWLCIHSGYLGGRRVSSGEGAWNANTGNGYYGGLQAHYGWGGVPRMDLLSAEAQMSVAERELRKNGGSHAWISGQWPNTGPPCLGLF
jgi:hypothetical protein